MKTSTLVTVLKSQLDKAEVEIIALKKHTALLESENSELKAENKRLKDFRYKIGDGQSEGVTG